MRLEFQEGLPKSTSFGFFYSREIVPVLCEQRQIIRQSNTAIKLSAIPIGWPSRSSSRHTVQRQHLQKNRSSC